MTVDENRAIYGKFHFPPKNRAVRFDVNRMVLKLSSLWENLVEGNLEIKMDDATL